MTNGNDGCQTGEVDKYEEQESVSLQCSKVVFTAIEHSNGRCDNLLSADTGQQTDVKSPVEALCEEQRLYGLTQQTNEALL